MKHLAIIAAFIGLFLVLTQFTYPVGPYVYDEADYMYATRLGFAANFLDRPAMPLADFIRTGLSQGRQASERRALSESIRESDDIPFYRHWHGPVYYYWLIFASLLSSSGDIIHRLSAVIPICTILLLYFGNIWLTPGREGVIQGALAAGLFGFSVFTVASMEIAPHHLFVFWSTLSLLLLAKTIQTGERRYFYAAVGVAGIVFGTLEMALILLCVLCLCAIVERKSLRLDWGLALRSVLLFTGTVLIVWPGAIFKLSFLKSYLGMGYLIVFRRGQSQWGNSTLAQTWLHRLTASPVEFALIAVVLAALILGPGLTTKRYLYPYVTFTILMLVATGTVPADAPRYALMFMPPMEFVVAAVLAMWLAHRSARLVVGASVGLCAALFAATFISVSRNPSNDRQSQAVLEFMRQNGLEHSTLVVPYRLLPMIHYYYPQTHLRSYQGDQPTPDDFTGKRFDGFFYPTFPVKYQPLAAQ